jgi:hypothetical protein
MAKSDKVYDRNAFYKWCQGMDSYKALEGVVGAMNATTLIGVIFEDRVRPPNNTLIFPAATEALQKEGFSEIFKDERNRIIGRQQYLEGLWKRALGGQLRFQLTASAEPDSYYKSPGNLSGRTLELEKARQWVVKSLKGNSNPVLAMLAKYVYMNQPQALGQDDAILRDIYRNVVVDPSPQKPPPWRGPVTADRSVKYPSSIGGSFLLRWMMNMTGHGFMPQKGDERWIDIALFYLGAIITVQAFADGNKRVARTAYAIVMVNSGVEFVAPNVKFENDLAQMAAK